MSLNFNDIQPGCFYLCGGTPVYCSLKALNSVYFIDNKKTFILYSGGANGWYICDAGIEPLDDEAQIVAFKEHVAKTILDLPVVGYNSTGADPEIFVQTTKGRLLPAFKFLPPVTKPLKFPYKGVPTIYHDGFAGEFTITPERCHSYTVDYIRSGLLAVLTAARKTDSSAKLVPVSTKMIPERSMATFAEDDIQMGCSPSLNAYGEECCVPAVPPREIRLRSAGFHIHQGIKGIKEESAINTVKRIDAIAGVVSVSLLKGVDSTIRRKIYGRAGEFRLPPHGLEYRVFSSAGLCHPAITHLLLDLTRFCCKLPLIAMGYWPTKGEDQVREIINEGDWQEARRVLAANKEALTKILKTHLYPTSSGTKMYEKALAVIMEGAKEHLNPMEMEKNWKLGGNWITHSDGPAENFRSLITETSFVKEGTNVT